MKKFVVVILIAFFPLIISACGSSIQSKEITSEEENMDKAMQVPPKDIIKLKGRIEYMNFEGGFYAFIDNKGKQYTPINLEKAHKKDGLNVSITAQKNLDIYTTTQFGEAIKIMKIDIIAESSEFQLRKLQQ